jgi:acyl-CoA synthetase (NDP forming)
MEASRKPAAVASAIGESIDRAALAGQSALDEYSAKLVLRQLGISVPNGVRIGTGDEAAGAIASLRPPFALKALSSEPIHKSDIGAVRLGLADVAAVESACGDIRAGMATTGNELTGFLIEEMVAPGIEIVIGGVKDPQLGPMIMVGAGGVFAEILQDVSFRFCPVDIRDADEMLAELKMAPILRGARGRAGVDLGRIRDALLALGGEDGLFLQHSARIREFDLNPLIAHPDGLVAVDCRIVLEGSGR